MSSFDRFSIAPLLIPIARDFHARLSVVALAATLYYLVYGLTQPIYGLLSDRFGRVPIMRWTLGAVAIGSIGTALVPSLGWLIGARLAVGATVGAVIPASLVYVGDSYPFNTRQHAIADISAATATGTALGIVGAGFLATYLSWRATFLVTALLSAILVVAFSQLPEPSRDQHPGGPLAQVWEVLSRGWAVFLILLALGEGIIFPGLTTYFAPALQARGVSAAAAGLVVAGYGVASLAGSRVIQRIHRRLSAAWLIAMGAAMLLGGYLLAATVGSIAGVLLGSVLAGMAFSFLHSTLQVWITEVVPRARGTAMALFATTLFLGASIGTATAAPLAQRHAYPVIFLGGAAVTLLVGILAGVGRHRYANRVSSALAETS